MRIGVLGAAKIVPMALVRPGRAVAGVEVTAIAARDVQRARRFAGRYHIPAVHRSYEALLADPEIDAVYNPLPPALHSRWTIAALEAGKHVLCEKPFAANGDDAAAVAEKAHATGLVVMEAFHYRYHALTRRILEILPGLGPLRRIDAWMHLTLPSPRNIRWNYALGGGATMDAGCYAMHWLRTLAGAEPEIVAAQAKTRYPNVDRDMHAELEFPQGVTGSLDVSLLSPKLFSAGIRVTAESGTLRVFNPLAPQIYHRLTVTEGGNRHVEHVPRNPSSYAAQLQAFADAVEDHKPFPTTVDDAVANMRALDACYAAAGLPRREPA